MTWTYDSTLSTDLSKVRLRVGDTDTADQLLTDEEINFQLGQTAGVAAASAACVKLILGQLARRIDRNGTGFSATRSQMFQHYKDLLAELEAEATSEISVTSDFGSISAKDSLESDSDFVPAAFYRNLHDNEDG